MRDDKRQTVKIELLSQWKLEAEFRKNMDRSIDLAVQRILVFSCLVNALNVEY